MKAMKAVVSCVCLAITMCALAGQASAQSKSDSDSYIDSLRADLRADKQAIVTDAMQLSEKETAAFWPVYRAYEGEVSKLNDELVRLVKRYADKFGSITNQDAAAQTQELFRLQARRTELKKKYFPQFEKATSSLTAAKFFQLEYRLELLFNLKMVSELPSLLIQASPVPEKK